MGRGFKTAFHRPTNRITALVLVQLAEIRYYCYISVVYMTCIIHITPQNKIKSHGLKFSVLNIHIAK